MKRILSALLILQLSTTLQAETQYSGTLHLFHFNVDNTQVRGPDEDDNFGGVLFAAMAHRQINSRLAMGAGLEYNKPVGRENKPGSGSLLGLRFASANYAWSERMYSELYIGAGMYEWIRTANGLYYGHTLGYRIGQSRLAIEWDAKFFHDLNYDNEFGDIVTKGYQNSLGLRVNF